MGQRQDKDEIVYGDNCSEGFDPGKTPKYVYARFSKLEKCPDPASTPPNDRVFKLTQSEVRPCFWLYMSPTWEVFFTIEDVPLLTKLSLYNPDDGFEHFLDTADGAAEEGKIYHNEFEECNHIRGSHLGIGVITWKLESLKVMGLLNIDTDSKLFMEMRPLADGSRVYKYCSLQDATNIAIKYEPT